MKFEDRYDSEVEVNVEKAVYYSLDGHDYDRGSVETAAATAENTLRAFSKLMQILAEKNLLTKEEIIEITGMYRYV